jgi:hypothetical protein
MKLTIGNLNDVAAVVYQSPVSTRRTAGAGEKELALAPAFRPVTRFRLFQPAVLTAFF